MGVKYAVYRLGGLLQQVASWGERAVEEQIDYGWFPRITKELVQKTPRFFLDETVVADRLDELERALTADLPHYQVAFSCKTNYQLLNLNMLRNRGVWAEVVSGHEYRLAKRSGYSPERIVFNGPAKTAAELAMALDEGALIQIDTWPQLHHLNRLYRRTVKGRVGIRVHGTDGNGNRSRFGFAFDTGEARQALVTLQQYRIPVSSFHYHRGTDLYDEEEYQASVARLGSFMASLDARILHSIRWLDLGGGIPAHGRLPFSMRTGAHWPELKPVSVYTGKYRAGLLQAGIKPDRFTILLEPGRYLIDDAVVWVVRVLEIKTEDDCQRVLTDGAVTQLPLVYYRPQIIQAYNSKAQQKWGTTKSVVYGASCREDDVLFQGQLPELDVGDCLIFYAVGAYNQSMGSGFIFG